MLYREAGQFKTTYGADQSVFPIRQDRIGIAIILFVAFVLVPLLMGIALAQYLYPRYGTGNPVVFGLFIGTAMSVTAFPVLARILMERNLLGTPLGSVAIACAAVDDLTAWILLSATVALATHDRNARIREHSTGGAGPRSGR